MQNKYICLNKKCPIFRDGRQFIDKTCETCLYRRINKTNSTNISNTQNTRTQSASLTSNKATTSENSNKINASKSYYSKKNSSSDSGSISMSSRSSNNDFRTSTSNISNLTYVPNQNETSSETNHTVFGSTQFSDKSINELYSLNKKLTMVNLIKKNTVSISIVATLLIIIILVLKNI